MKRSGPMIAVFALMACAAANSQAAELQPATLTAWNAYLKEADFQAQQRASGRMPFLWMDETPERAARVHRGDVVIAPVTAHGPESIPGGLIHDWIGTIFIPGARVESLLSVVHDYDRYRLMYEPAVVASRTLACSQVKQEFQMVWQRKVLFVNTAIQGITRRTTLSLTRIAGIA
jgi:hypothetical protein